MKVKTTYFFSSHLLFYFDHVLIHNSFINAMILTLNASSPSIVNNEEMRLLLFVQKRADLNDVFKIVVIKLKLEVVF